MSLDEYHLLKWAKRKA